MNHERCEDDLMLQRFVDEELSPDTAEIVLYHVEKCVSCGERLQNLKIVKAFCREQLGREDEFESEFTQNALLRVRSRLDIPKAAATPQNIGSTGRIAAFFDRLRSRIAGFAVGWRMVTVPAGLFLVFAGLVVWFAISPSSNISADEILSESERRTLIWRKQPDKVLHWVTESIFSNHLSGLPDGKYRSLYWKNNTGGKSFMLTRIYDESGTLIWAKWKRTDGADIYFNHFPQDEIKIYPTTAVLRAYAARLDEKSRQTLENYVGLSDQPAQMNPETSLQTKQKSLTKWFDRGNVQIVQIADIGKVFRIRRVFEPRSADKFTHGEMEHDIAADTFMTHRHRETSYFPDGKTAVEDSQIMFYRETSVEDFNAHDLTAEMRQVKRIVQITPEEVLKEAQRRDKEK